LGWDFRDGRGKGVRPMTAEQVHKESRLLILRPLGAQGPRVGLQITSREDMEKLDQAFGSLSLAEKKTAEGARRAAREAGIGIVDF